MVTPMFRQPMLSLIGIWIVVTIGWFGFVTRGGEVEFSPHTLEMRSRNEYFLMGRVPLFPMRWKHWSSGPEFIEILVDEGHITPVEPNGQPRWISVTSWDGVSIGKGDLYRTLFRRAANDWTAADHERARFCWSRVFELLRSDDERDVKIGCILAYEIRRFKTAAEFDENLSYYRDNVPP